MEGRYPGLDVSRQDEPTLEEAGEGVEGGSSKGRTYLAMPRKKRCVFLQQGFAAWREEGSKLMVEFIKN